MRVFILTGYRLALIIVMLLLAGAIFNVGFQLISPVLASGTYSRINTQEKIVALTFDDGPSQPYTRQILDILKEQKVRATFFVLGESVRSNTDLLRRMVNEGHEIGNHGFSHDYRQRKLLEELNRSEQTIYSVTGIHTYFYRPPGGFINKWQFDSIKNKGYVVTLWSVDSRDWQRPGVNKIVRNVVEGVFPGAIILLHDGGGLRKQTVEALGLLITEMRARGYSFVTLSELRIFDQGKTGMPAAGN